MDKLKKALRSFFYYETVKIVTIKNLMVGVIYRLIQFAILIYIAVYAMYLQKGYQDFSEVESAVTTKVKGIAFTNFSDDQFVPEVDDPNIYRRVWDVADYVVPASENGAFFVATNIIITPNQTQTTCPEDPSVEGAICNAANPCQKGYISLLGNGVRTGRCIKSDFPNTTDHVCEIYGWCPVEKDIRPLINGSALLKASKDFTVLIKNNIKFPKFNVNRRNILDTANETYLQSCRFNEDTDKLCPVFVLGDIVRNARQNYNEIAAKGGVIAIVIDWQCNLDLSYDKCIPKYSFERLDDPHAKLAKGWNFRYANYYGDNSRTLYKLYGIRFVVLVQGRGGKFNFVPFFITLGSGLGILVIASVVCDLMVLYVVKMRDYYKAKKFLYVEGNESGETTPVINKQNDFGHETLEAEHSKQISSRYHSLEDD